MDTVSRMGELLFEENININDDDEVIQTLRNAGFKDQVINVFLDEAIDIAMGLHQDAEESEQED